MKALTSFVVALTLATVAVAQPSAYTAVQQPLAVLPAVPSSLAVADSHLYAFFDKMVMVSSQHDGELQGFMPDTNVARLADNANYLVRRGNGETCYYTAPDRHGRNTLHYVYRDGKRLKTKRIDIDGYEVWHPTFSADGNIVVFTARHKERSRGAFDLWYSRRVDGDWTAPVNLGERINTAGNELSPTIVGNHLFFTSDGRDESKGKLNIYVAHLFNDGVVSDTAGMLQFGRGRVQRLPEPFNNTASDCYDLVVDTALGSAYWLQGQQVMGYHGDLHGVSVWGHVVDADGRPLQGVAVEVSDDMRQVSATATDAQGFYRICLPVNRRYTLAFRSDGRYTARVVMDTKADRQGLLIGEQRRDITLDGLPVGRPIYYSDLFGPNASVDLNERGREVLDQLARFLADNPSYGATVMLSCDLLADTEFNSLFTDERLLAVERYLLAKAPADAEIGFVNLCDGREGCSDATGESRLTVVLQ